MTVATDLAHEQAQLERRVERAEQKAAVAEHNRYLIAQQLKLEQSQSKRAQQKMARHMAESATALLTSAIAVYVAMGDDPQHARSRLQSYLAARLNPVLGAPIPEHPWGPDQEL